MALKDQFVFAEKQNETTDDVIDSSNDGRRAERFPFCGKLGVKYC
jgi:hypothetical protein